MTSLEFIEKQIDIYKSVKQRAILQIPDEDDEEELYKLQDKIDICNERISYFQQIKSELEAWEVVKKKVKPVLKMDKEDYQPAYYWWIAEEIINLDTLDYQKLKNALEVER